ncbi:M28 family peptidase [Candidatus Methylocalor cossyra]|uniref:Peptidase M28-like protein n=1 Tax=Candidatus Methylocalor cossyra TaxID=3108543 RepID=A0ABP1CA67_9GAMM
MLAGLSERLETHVRALAEAIGERNVLLPQALRAAEDYIAGQWQDQGYPVRRYLDRLNGVDCATLEVTVPGCRNPASSIVVGAHYDSVFGSPGADDNASGVAALLELSRQFLKARPLATVRFVAFANEEPPFFAGRHMGSLIYARTARRRGERIRFMVSLEMLGYYDDRPGSQRYPLLLKHFFPDRGNFIAFVSNWRSRIPLRQLAGAFRAHCDFPLECLSAPPLVPGIAASDHFSFWRQGYPALMVTDTAYYRNRWYHTAGDLPWRLSYDPFAQVVAGLYEALRVCSQTG